MKIKLNINQCCNLVALCADLLTVSKQRSTSVCCVSSQISSCNAVFVNPEDLGQATLNLLEGVQVTFSDYIAGNENAYHYKSDVADVVITYNPSTGGMHGHAMLSSGQSFVLENCGSQGHVLKEIDVSNLEESEGVDTVADTQNEIFDAQSLNQLKYTASNDNVTSVTYSIKFYYTPDFAASTPDIAGFITQVLAETNSGYANSMVPLVATAHCIEEATINDVSSASTMLTNFRNMKSSVAELRGGADVAAILVNNFDYCGIGYVNTISNGLTLSATQKSCAVGYYSFGHEVGHNIGLLHDPANSINPYYAYGTGHLIAAGSSSTGYRTILAYYAPGHSQRANVYSNPQVIYPLTGTPVGVEGVSNNAAVLLQNRMALAAIGDVVCCARARHGAPLFSMTCKYLLLTLRGDHLFGFHFPWMTCCDAKGMRLLAKMCVPPCVGITCGISMFHR